MNDPEFFFAKYSVTRTDEPDSLTTRQISHFFMETYLSLFWIKSILSDVLRFVHVPRDLWVIAFDKNNR